MTVLQIIFLVIYLIGIPFYIYVASQQGKVTFITLIEAMLWPFSLIIYLGLIIVDLIS
jgi:hypothetical protein